MLPVVEDMLSGTGAVTLNLLNSGRFVAVGRINIKHVFQQMALVGADSVPIALMINFIAGAVLALHAAERFAQTGANAYVGALVTLAVVREMAPMFAALSVGARAGTAIAAEVANMAVTNQLDALRVMRVNPIRYLMVPRVLACVISLPLVTLLSELIGVVGGMITAKFAANIHYSIFLDSVWLILKPWDITSSLIKAVVFGMIVAGISVTTGLSTRGGARNVGLATTQATVWIAITVIIADFFMTWMFFGTSFRD